MLGSLQQGEMASAAAGSTRHKPTPLHACMPHFHVHVPHHMAPVLIAAWPGGLPSGWTPGVFLTFIELSPRI
jgi:hypothetical protein